MAASAAGTAWHTLTSVMAGLVKIGILAGLLMLSLPGETWVRLAVWMAVGMAVYLAYGARRRPART